MRRRTLLSAFCAVAGTGGALGQPSNKSVCVAVITGLEEHDAETKARLGAFRDGMKAAGWREGQNISIDVRYAPDSPERARVLVAELLALKPDIALIQAPAMQAMREANPTIPVVFMLGGDPVAARWVESLAHPGGNYTGLTSADPTIAGKWIEFLREVIPDVRHIVAVSHEDPTNYAQQFESVSKQLGLDIRSINVSAVEEIEPILASLAAQPKPGLVLPTSAFTTSHRTRIAELTLKYRLPTISGSDPFASAGALVVYAVDTVDVYRRAAGYVDRILRGTSPADLPVQRPTVFRLTVNQRTAKALGLIIPPAMLARADVVVE